MTGIQRYSDLAGTQSVANSVYDYDLAGRLTDLTHQRGNAIIADYGFTYDAANRLTQLVTPDGTSNYTYNNRNELTSGDHTDQPDEAYTYDATGNRTNHTTGNHNRLLSDGQYTYTYDNEGNRTRRVDTTTSEVTDYTWDYRNRMTSVVTKASNGTVTERIEYTYDVYDRRIAKSIDPDGAGPQTATEEHFIYDGDHIALVFDETGSETHRYLHGPQIDQVLAEETANGETHWALSDHQGSIRDVIDNAGTVLNHIVYDSFGQVTSESNPAFDFRFGYTGRERDEETGLLYYRARYYDPAVGTFVSADPLGFGAGDANLYRYVGNSPTNFIDPDGQNRIRRAWNAVLTNDTVYNTVNRADQFTAGFGNSVYLGATNRIRSTLYGETATRNHRGAFYAAGSLTGEIALSTVANAATAPRWVRRAYNAYDTARDIYDVGRSTYNIARDINSGCGAGSLDDWLTLGGAIVGSDYRDRMIARNIADEASALGRAANQIDAEESAALTRRANQERIEAACFVAGTPVLTAKGQKAIETLRPGD